MARINRLGVLIAVLSAVPPACGSAPADGDELRSEVSRVGDTTIVVNHGEPTHTRGDNVRVVWRSPELIYPHTLLLLEDRLIVGDEKRIHILSLEGELLRTVGREGHGPREFEYVAELAQFGTDTLAVHDAENQRISFFTPNGDFLGVARYEPLLPYGNPVNGYLPATAVRRGLVRLRDGVLSFWRERIPWTRPTRTALVWHDIRADTAVALESWEGERWFRAGGRWAATTEVFPPFVIAALSPDGHLAVGDGIEYCVTMHVVMQRAFRRVCRDRAPAPVGEGIRHPDVSRSARLAALVREQRIPEHLPHFDRLLFDDAGRLWVRTLGEEMSNLRPDPALDAVGLRPRYRTWDVFDETGRLVKTVEIPSHFEPQVIQAREMYGFVELPMGEVAVGVLAVRP